MKNNPVIIFLFLGGAFAAGYFLNTSSPMSHSPARAVLYYIDPMHPSYKSDAPGIAPDCGMKLEPVYSGASGPEQSSSEIANPVPGTVRIAGEQQQLIGIKIGTVEKKTVSQTIRMLGRIAVDETRIFRINATIDGWVTQSYPNAAGSFVRKNEVLAGFYSPDFLSAQQAFLYALSSQDRVTLSSSEIPGRDAQLQQFNINIKQYRDALMNLGMGLTQIEEISRSRQYGENINIVSPADGVIMMRGVSQGQRFEKGTELYRITDLSRVWILADVFENETRFLKPGVVARVNVPNQNRTFLARVSNALPQFDPASRTLKLRLEADNPGYILKPDMFVDVELLVNLPPALTVPVDALVDSGLRRIVFVDRGEGYFEPRRVETGWRKDGMVEITRGLMNKERIVISGTFMLDSESRMQAAAQGVFDEGVLDPVCGMYIDEKKAKAAGRVSRVGTRDYYFCSPACLQEFGLNQELHTRPESKPGKINAPMPHAGSVHD